MAITNTGDAATIQPSHKKRSLNIGKEWAYIRIVCHDELINLALFGFKLTTRYVMHETLRQEHEDIPMREH